MAQKTTSNSWQPNALDARITASIAICLVVSVVLTALDLKFSAGEMRLDIIQRATACISCLLCCQDTADASRKAGGMRVLVTVVGGVCGMAIVILDQLLGNSPLVLAALATAGLVPTLCLCRAAGAPAFNARIGAISYLLVATTLTGTARLWYALFRVVSTIFGALVVWGVTALMNTENQDSNSK